jgi:quinol monooxygenase YgiN
VVENFSVPSAPGVPYDDDRRPAKAVRFQLARAKMIHVIATIELHEGRREAFLAEFHRVVPSVLAEEGCLDYGPTVDLPTGIAAQPPPRPDVVTIIEKWASLEHLERHLVAPHMSEYRPKVKEFIVRATLLVLAPA